MPRLLSQFKKEIGMNGLYIRARSLSNGEMIDIKCKTSSGCSGFGSITTCSSTVEPNISFN